MTNDSDYKTSHFAFLLYKSSEQISYSRVLVCACDFGVHIFIIYTECKSKCDINYSYIDMLMFFPLVASS